MKCTTCNNKNVKKIFMAGADDMNSKMVACDACIGKKVKKTKKRTTKKK